MPHFHSRAVCGCALRTLAVLAGILTAHESDAQLQITEVMHTPLGNANLWEWIEVRNTSASPVDLNGWIIDDDDDVPLSEATGANIKNTNGNTVVPAGGVAILYAGSDLGYTPSRFTNAWAPGITLIPVTGLTTLTATDAIGLWPHRTAYLADDLGEGQNPRRNFAHASVALDYQLEFPQVEVGHSIAWKGTGDFRDAANWVQSRVGMLQASASVATSLASAPLNGEDHGNPGVVPGGLAPVGLHITEVMAAPDSPEPAWEWVEVHNNTGSAINFASQHHVLHDNDGADFSNANITSGVLPQGGVGVLFNAAANTIANMQAAWGSDINYIPVTSWGNGFSNSGDTIAIWDSIDDYDRDKPGGGRSTDHALAVVTYETTNPWPSGNNASSVYLKNLGYEPAFGESWIRSGSEDEPLDSDTSTPVLGTVVDHPSGDIGSPGKVGTATGGVLGDYSGNNVVDAADYTVWRDRMNGGSLPNDASPGNVTIADYNYWKSRFGATLGNGAIAAVPEPATLAMPLVAIVAVMVGRGASFRSRSRRPILRSRPRLVRQ